MCNILPVKCLQSDIKLTALHFIAYAVYLIWFYRFYELTSTVLQNQQIEMQHLQNINSFRSKNALNLWVKYLGSL